MVSNYSFLTEASNALKGNGRIYETCTYLSNSSEFTKKRIHHSGNIHLDYNKTESNVRFYRN